MSTNPVLKFVSSANQLNSQSASTAATSSRRSSKKYPPSRSREIFRDTPLTKTCRSFRLPSSPRPRPLPSRMTPRISSRVTSERPRSSLHSAFLIAQLRRRLTCGTSNFRKAIPSHLRMSAATVATTPDGTRVIVVAQPRPKPTLQGALAPYSDHV